NTESRVEILGSDRAPVLLDGLTGNGEAEAGTGGFCREVWIKYPGEDFRRNSRAVVLDRYDHSGVEHVAAKPDNAARCSLERILDEVGNCAAEHPRIACELRRRGRRDVCSKIDTALPAVGVTGRNLFQP